MVDLIPGAMRPKKALSRVKLGGRAGVEGCVTCPLWCSEDSNQASGCGDEHENRVNLN